VLRHEQVNLNTSVELDRLLKTRGMTTPTTRAEKVTAVERLLQHERARELDGDIGGPRLRDPDGGSLHMWLLERRPEHAGKFAQLDVIHRAPEGDGWVSDLSMIQNVAPILNQVTMRRYYESKIRDLDGRTKVWIGGYRRVVNKTHISSFKYHPPTADRPHLCWVRYHCAASMRKDGYTVTAWPDTCSLVPQP
jgi:hypothetical protein